MTMTANGLAKLIEECGEVIQIAGKLLAYPKGVHPDGKGHLHTRLENELADLSAAMTFVAETHNLDELGIHNRKTQKLHQFRAWHADPNN